MSQIDVLKIIAKNVGTAITDTLSFNMGSAIKNSAEEIKEYSKLTNDALYHLQIQKFLETADLDSEEVEDFLKESPDNQRLGLELFKVLEKTHLEKQAELMAIAFKRYVKKEITKSALDKYNHIIDNLTRHNIKIIEDDANGYLESIKRLDKHHKYYGLQLKNSFTGNQHHRVPELIALGFMEEVVETHPISQYELERAAKASRDFKLKQDKYFKRTNQYYDFMVSIYFRTICTQ